MVSVAIMLCGFVAFAPASPVQAAGTVGTGTAGSCTEGALNTALIGGGIYNFGGIVTLTNSTASGNSADDGSVEVRQPTYPLCASYYTGAVTSPLSGGCGAGTIAIEPYHQTFCLNMWSGRVLYLSGRPCTSPRIAHTVPDDGDLLTCVSYHTGANRWVQNHSQCKANEAPNTIPAAG